MAQNHRPGGPLVEKPVICDCCSKPKDGHTMKVYSTSDGLYSVCKECRMGLRGIAPVYDPDNEDAGCDQLFNF